MTGFDLQVHLTAVGCAIPIIFITAYDDGPTRQRALKAGATDYLRKPFSKLALVKALARALEGDPAEQKDSGGIPDGWSPYGG